MELFNYYSLDECLNLKSVKKKLNELKDDGKIDFCIDQYVLKLEDLYLDDSETSDLIKFFDDNDVFVNSDYEEEDDDYDSFRDYDDDDDIF